MNLGRRSTTDATRWDDALEECASPAPLLQTWAWGEVQSRVGWNIDRVRLAAGAIASVQLRQVGPVREAYVPRGPVPSTPGAIDALIEWASGAKIAKLTVEPDAPPSLAEALKERGFTAAHPTQPATTRILPLSPPEAMLASFDRGTRYNIRLAERKGVVVEVGTDAAELARQSAPVEARQGINLPGRAYYELLLSVLPWCRTYVARHPETKVAVGALLTVRHSGRGYNLFAGRSGAHPDLKANELLHWCAIRDCAEAGMRDYDLWGVPPAQAGPDHPWHGLGRFKAGFGGEEVAYVGAWELVLSTSGARLVALERRARAYVRGLKRNIS